MEDKKFELKPCPFCGGEAVSIVKIQKSGTVLSAKCNKCSCGLPGGGFYISETDNFSRILEKMNMVKNKWNMRYQDGLSESN